MTYEMRNIRKEDTSLYYYLKHIVLQDFIEKDEMVPLQLLEEASCYEDNVYVYEALTFMAPSPTERGRGWVYLDTCSGTTTICNLDTNGDEITGLSGIKEQSTRVRVYDINQILIDEDEYLVDYVDGRIVTSGTVSPYYVTYDWYYISLVDEWAAISAADPPVVVIDLMGTDKAGYQLGAGRRVVRKVDIHVFASDPAERNDIVDTIYDGLYLKCATFYDFPKGTMLEYDGTWYGRKTNMNKLTTLFDNSTLNYLGTNINASIGGVIQFENVTSRHINLPLIMTRSADEVLLSDLNAYRSKVSFDLVYYTYI